MLVFFLLSSLCFCFVFSYIKMKNQMCLTCTIHVDVNKRPQIRAQELQIINTQGHWSSGDKIYKHIYLLIKKRKIKARRQLRLDLSSCMCVCVCTNQCCAVSVSRYPFKTLTQHFSVLKAGLSKTLPFSVESTFVVFLLRR